jgi:hypothetical protein
VSIVSYTDFKYYYLTLHRTLACHIQYNTVYMLFVWAENEEA